MAPFKVSPCYGTVPFANAIEGVLIYMTWGEKINVHLHEHIIIIRRDQITKMKHNLSKGLGILT